MPNDFQCGLLLVWSPPSPYENYSSVFQCPAPPISMSYLPIPKCSPRGPLSGKLPAKIPCVGGRGVYGIKLILTPSQVPVAYVRNPALQALCIWPWYLQWEFNTQTGCGISMKRPRLSPTSKTKWRRPLGATYTSSNTETVSIYIHNLYQFFVSIDSFGLRVRKAPARPSFPRPWERCARHALLLWLHYTNTHSPLYIHYMVNCSKPSYTVFLGNHQSPCLWWQRRNWS